MARIKWSTHTHTPSHRRQHRPLSIGRLRPKSQGSRTKPISAMSALLCDAIFSCRPAGSHKNDGLEPEFVRCLCKLTRMRHRAQAVAYCKRPTTNATKGLSGVAWRATSGSRRSRRSRVAHRTRHRNTTTRFLQGSNNMRQCAISCGLCCDSHGRGIWPASHVGHISQVAVYVRPASQMC